MADIQPTLDLIDGAIEDYISPDAMRWTPEQEQRAESRSWRGLSQSRMWIDGVEVTDHITSVELGPMVEEATRIDMSDWREHISHLRTASWNLDVPVSVVVGDEAHLWAAANPTVGAQPGQVGDLLGIPVIESPLAPEGQVLLVNPPRLQDLSFAPGPFSYSDDMHTCRIMAHFAVPSYAHMIIYDEWNHRGSRWVRLSRRGAGWTAPRNHPRVRALHSAYRHRQLARRRRNR